MFPTIEPKSRIPLSLLSSTRTTVEVDGATAPEKIRGVTIAGGALDLNRVPLFATNVYEDLTQSDLLAAHWIYSTSSSPGNVFLEGIPSGSGSVFTYEGQERYGDVAFLNSQGVYMSIQNLTAGTSCICTISTWTYYFDKLVTFTRTLQRILGQDPYDVMVPGDSLQFYIGNGL